MEMTGEQLIPIAQADTWRALNDTEILKACVPGCESIERVSDSEYNLVMTAKVGPVRAKFKGTMRLTDVEPPNTYTIVFEGQGGVAGFAKGQATVNLSAEGDSTRLKYTAKATIGGKLAQVGARLINGVARKMADQFFKNFNQHASGGAAS